MGIKDGEGGEVQSFAYRVWGFERAYFMFLGE